MTTYGSYKAHMQITSLLHHHTLHDHLIIIKDCSCMYGIESIVYLGCIIHVSS